jgi:hypothetical protein
MLQVGSTDTINLNNLSSSNLVMYGGYILIALSVVILLATIIYLTRSIIQNIRFPKNPTKILKKMYNTHVKLKRRQKHWQRHFENLWTHRKDIKVEDLKLVPDEFTAHFYSSLLNFVPPRNPVAEERGKEYLSLPPVISNIQVVTNLLSEFKRGGFVGYFKSPHFVEMYQSAKAFREIGASQSAEIIEDSFEAVMDRSRQEQMHIPSGALPYQQHIETTTGRPQRSLQELSKELSIRLDKIYAQLALYMRSNAEYILQYIQGV